MNKEIKFLKWVSENGFKPGAINRWWKWFDQWFTYKDGSKAKGYLSFPEAQIFDLYNSKKITP